MKSRLRLKLKYAVSDSEANNQGLVFFEAL